MRQVAIGPEGTATVVLNGSGNGTAKVGPIGARENWTPAAAAVSVSTRTAEAQCKLFVGPSPTADNYIGGTLSGSTGDSTGRVSAQPVPLGSFVWAVWAGGDPGSVATLSVQGTKNV